MKRKKILQLSPTHTRFLNQEGTYIVQLFQYLYEQSKSFAYMLICVLSILGLVLIARIYLFAELRVSIVFALIGNTIVSYL